MLVRIPLDLSSKPVLIFWIVWEVDQEINWNSLEDIKKVFKRSMLVGCTPRPHSSSWGS